MQWKLNIPIHAYISIITNTVITALLTYTKTIKYDDKPKQKRQAYCKSLTYFAELYFNGKIINNIIL